MDDVLLNKAATIERCIKRVKEEYTDEVTLSTNYTKQDAVILNILRACEAAIDMAMRVVRLRKLGVPQTSREVFQLLEQNKLIDSKLSQRMQAMVGFRNIAVHDYTVMDLAIVNNIVHQHLADFLLFTKTLLQVSTGER